MFTLNHVASSNFFLQLCFWNTV